MLDDPETWERAWSAEFPMMKAEGPLYEFACHQGNYGIMNTLRGARAADRAADEAVTPAPR